MKGQSCVLVHHKQGAAGPGPSWTQPLPLSRTASLGGARPIRVTLGGSGCFGPRSLANPSVTSRGIGTCPERDPQVSHVRLLRGSMCPPRRFRDRFRGLRPGRLHHQRALGVTWVLLADDPSSGRGCPAQSQGWVGEGQEGSRSPDRPARVTRAKTLGRLRPGLRGLTVLLLNSPGRLCGCHTRPEKRRVCPAGRPQPPPSEAGAEPQPGDQGL